MTRAFQPLANVLMMVAKNLNGFLNFEITRWVTFRVLKKILFNNSRASKSFPSHDTLTNYIVNFYHVIGHVMFEINLVRFFDLHGDIALWYVCSPGREFFFN